MKNVNRSSRGRNPDHVGHEAGGAGFSPPGQTVRAVARGRGQAQSRSGARGAEVRTPVSLDDRAFLTGVFRGAGGIFAMIPAEITPPRTLRGEQERRSQRGPRGEPIRESRREESREGLRQLSAPSAAGTRRGRSPGLHVFEELLDEGSPGLNVVPPFEPGLLSWRNQFGSIGASSRALASTVSGDSSPMSRIPMVANARHRGRLAAEYLSKLDFKGRKRPLRPRGEGLHDDRGDADLGARPIGKGPTSSTSSFPEGRDFKKGLFGCRAFSANLADLFVEMSRGFQQRAHQGANPGRRRNTTPDDAGGVSARTVLRGPAFKGAPRRARQPPAKSRERGGPQAGQRFVTFLSSCTAREDSPS